MEKIPVTVFVLTRNSAATLSRALASAEPFADVLVCDGGSTDDTRAIAERYGARIVPQSAACLENGHIKDFACVRNAGIKEARYDWVLSIDSDESVSDELVQEIRMFLNDTPAPAACKIPAGIMLDGVRIRHSSNYPGYQFRFFNRKAGEYRKPIHERFTPVPGLPVHTFRSPWFYYVDSATIQAEFESDLRRDMLLYKERFAPLNLVARLYSMMRAGRAIVGIVVRTIWQNILHPGATTYPLHLEWLRVRYQLEILRVLLGLSSYAV